MSKSKNLELTGFDPNTGLMVNGEPVQPKITGLGGDQTPNEIKVDRSKEVTINSAYKSNLSRNGAIACLNLILQKGAVHFVDSSCTGPARSVVMHPTISHNQTIRPSPFTFSVREWKIIVSISKEYEKSPFILREISLKRYGFAIQQLDAEVYDAYVSAGILPNENQIVQSSVEVTSTVSGLPSPPIVD